MRIDYSEPKKSYISPQSGSSRPRKESSNSLVLAVIITGVISLSVGFGFGWILSQSYAKKGFKAAMEQQSLENSPQPAAVQPPAPKPRVSAPQVPSEPLQLQAGGSSPQGAQVAPETALSFYKTLPSGQKSNVLGSGINTGYNNTAKQPLQAAIPKNLTKPPQPQTPANSTKPHVSAPPEKPAARIEPSGFTVQVASYSLKSEADTLKSKLAGKGYNVYILESNQGDKGTWYRVRVGKRLEQDAAKELADKLGKGAMPISEKD